ncbi:MAG: hypothetical protein K5873_06855 [Treponema sp.]|nr:hypothetical protein [Treponema sp.]
MAVGREFRELKRTVKFLTKYSEEGVFKMPFSFWFRLCALIQGRKASKSNVLHLLHMTKEEKEFYGTYVRNIPELLEKAGGDLLDNVLKEVKGLFR